MGAITKCLERPVPQHHARQGGAFGFGSWRQGIEVPRPHIAAVRRAERIVPAEKDHPWWAPCRAISSY